MRRQIRRQIRTPGKGPFAWKGVPWAIGSLFLIIATVALYFSTATAASRPSLAEKPGASDITYGPATAQVVLVEYSDFQCQFCAEYAKILGPLREKYRDQVRFVFRFFPLSNHEYGMISAQAAYAAFLQDKFWEMHDLIYANQREWSESDDPRPYFDTYASQVGLDIDKFHEDLDAEATKDFVSGQRSEGDKAGVTHTPWFIINDLVVTPRTAADFESLFQERL